MRELSEKKLSRGGWLGFLLAALLGVSPNPVQPSPMVKIPSGTFTPLFKGTRSDGAAITVKGFSLDQYPVTVSEYREFIRIHPQWGVSRRGSIFADAGYLSGWSDNLQPGAPERSPVTNVSWFAAKAYCAAQGRRLPTAAEWEFAALASETQPDGRSEEGYAARILAWYSKPTMSGATVGSHRNYYGVYDLHGLIWEWVSDFNTEVMTGESRSDGDIESDMFCGAGALQASEKSRSDYAAFMRYAFRGSLQGSYTVKNLGFRCAQSQ